MEWRGVRWRLEGGESERASRRPGSRMERR
jgi:hypothetical protein